MSAVWLEPDPNFKWEPKAESGQELPVGYTRVEWQRMTRSRHWSTEKIRARENKEKLRIGEC